MDKRFKYKDSLFLEDMAMLLDSSYGEREQALNALVIENGCILPFKSETWGGH